ncbi:DUF4065 domain-containing protein [Candidatus Liberibacter africanus]|uniref:Phage-associated protein n=1 Tax=Candidatus Liberibacter africanus PTSAPSY TaxID=1277257 RepID=A0A0G3I9Q2_LIBAF|nr:type II toxin-antitoxin system antitoxin SocA domain-containing protein [Candidatus Liberibacter africanus]AKK20517.1 phage-associated protein [Candidatus Liberibacter africanus PTSAPSY]QTP64226.1 DUF4065 domain-containing protein [Candidatus Liberibacter africanus]
MQKIIKDKKPPYCCLSVANFFIDKGVKSQLPVTNLKLQKLLYFTHCNIVLKYKKAMLDEEPQAWGKGPLFAGIYHRFKYFYDYKIRLPMALALDVFPEISDRNIINIMNDIWDRYKECLGNELSKIAHEAGRAWEKSYGPSKPYLNKTITVDDILKYETKY